MGWRLHLLLLRFLATVAVDAMLLVTSATVLQGAKR